ncbi:MAG: hypothetical protein R2865_15115 [Deinococcales bacterium]
MGLRVNQRLVSGPLLLSKNATIPAQRQITTASPEALETLKLLAALNAREDVVYVQPNYIRRISRTPNKRSI